MSLAVREVSVAKGYDPRDFALVASGGAGPLHVCAIARELYIPTVIVPLFPSHFSALGMLLADERHDFTRTVYCRSRQRRFRQARRGARRDGEGRQGAACATPRTRSTRSISTCATWARSSRCRCRSRSSSSRSGDRKAHPHRVRRALRACATRTIRRTSRSRWSTSGSAPSASGRSSASRASASGGAPRRPANAQAYFTSASKPLTAKVYRREALGAGARDRRAGADPGARHHHGAVRERHVPRWPIAAN